MVPISLAVEYEAIFLPISPSPEPSRSEEYPKLQWHVEAWEAIHAVKCGTGNIVNAVSTFGNDVVELLYTDFSTIAGLERAAGLEAAVVNRKHERPK